MEEIWALLWIAVIAFMVLKMLWHYVLYLGCFKKTMSIRDMKKFLKAEKVIISGGDKMALQVMKSLSDKNVPIAKYYLATMHYHGMGAVKNESLAYELINEGAELNDPRAKKAFRDGLDSIYMPGYTKNMVSKYCEDYDLNQY